MPPGENECDTPGPACQSATEGILLLGETYCILIVGVGMKLCSLLEEEQFLRLKSQKEENKNNHKPQVDT